MQTESKIQKFVHQLDQGAWAKYVPPAVVLAALAFVASLWFFGPSGFRGLNHEKAMEQAQIGRELAHGHGFTTKVIRPAAMAQFREHHRPVSLEHIPDIYYAPIYPIVAAATIKGADLLDTILEALGNSKPMFRQMVFERTMTPKQVVYTYDKFIVFVELLCFFAAMIVNYFIARRLFDHRLAVLAVCLCLICERFWDFAFSGLPQMLLLLLFSGAIYTMLRSHDALRLEKNTAWWAAGTGSLFGLLALTHSLTIWIFLGYLVYSLIYFRPRGRDVLIMSGVFLALFAPWLVRNQLVCGSPFGIGWLSALSGLKGSEAAVMRTADTAAGSVTTFFSRGKVQSGILEQFNHLYAYLGALVVAPVFFISLLHPFKRRETAHFRWAVLLMWLSAVLGMAIFGFPEEGPVRANDLHVLFIPVVSFYGLAFVLLMWSRLEIHLRLFRIAFLTAIFLISSGPFLMQMVALIRPPQTFVPQWPPYFPPSIAILRQWTLEREIVVSDMPWAVAWYADRKSVWLPMTIKEFLELNDNLPQNHIAGLYLTPVTGNRPFVMDIAKGEYKEWAGFILRTVNTTDFPLKAKTSMPLFNECIFYSDRDRWTNHED